MYTTTANSQSKNAQKCFINKINPVFFFLNGSGSTYNKYQSCYHTWITVVAMWCLFSISCLCWSVWVMHVLHSAPLNRPFPGGNLPSPPGAQQRPDLSIAVRRLFQPKWKFMKHWWSLRLILLSPLFFSWHFLSSSPPHCQCGSLPSNAG